MPKDLNDTITETVAHTLNLLNRIADTNPAAALAAIAILHETLPTLRAAAAKLFVEIVEDGGNDA